MSRDIQTSTEITPLRPFELQNKAQRVAKFASYENDKLLALVNSCHRDGNKITEELERLAGDLDSPLRFPKEITDFRHLLQKAKMVDTKEFVKGLFEFSQMVAPFNDTDRFRYALYFPEAFLVSDFLENFTTFSNFDSVLPVGLANVMQIVSQEKRDGSFMSLFTNKQVPIRKELMVSSKPTLLFKNPQWPVEISMRNLIGMGPDVAYLALENSEMLRGVAAEKFPENVGEMEDLLHLSDLILKEVALSHLSNFRIHVLGQLAKVGPADFLRNIVLNEATYFSRIMTEGQEIDALLKADTKGQLEAFNIDKKLSLYRGWFAYKSLQVGRGELPSVWGAKIKDFNWEGIIQDRQHIYSLKKNNRWLLD